LRLHLREWGDPGAPPLVCLHGVTSYGGHFRRLAEELLADRFRVLAPDLRGHGRSGYEPPWSLDTHVADVAETLEAAGAVPAVWLGHSFGGRLVIEIAVRSPELVRRAVLLDPAIRIRPDNASGLADEVRIDHSFATPEEAIPPLTAGEFLHTPPEYVAEHRREHLTRSADGRFRWRYSPSAVVVAFSELASAHAPVERIRAQTLLLLGESSGLVGPRQLEFARSALGELLTVRTVPGGHVVLWDAYAETAAAVAEFLAAS
jgi:lipase